VVRRPRPRGRRCRRAWPHRRGAARSGSRGPAAAARRPRSVRRPDQCARYAGALALAPQAPVLAARGVPRRAHPPHLRRAPPLSPAAFHPPPAPPPTPRGGGGFVWHPLDLGRHDPPATRTGAETPQRLRPGPADRRETPLPAATAQLIEAFVAVKAPARAAA